MEYRLEVVSVPVSDVDRAKEFYQRLGWRLDADFSFGDGARLVQFTSPGSACSIHFGTDFVTSAPPGSAQGLELVVDDIEAARAQLIERGVEVSDVFHRDGDKPVAGPDPGRASYSSFVSFNDPDGNGWVLQEVTSRADGRPTSVLAVYGSVPALADALRRAAAAHGRHEQEIGHADENWPDWYAQYMADESAGSTPGTAT